MFEIRDMEKEAARLRKEPEVSTHIEAALEAEAEAIREANGGVDPIEFRAFPKIPRLRRGITITEKIDGTNAGIIITEDGRIAAQARNGIITPGKTTDNYGFAGWVQDNKDELMKLGPGYHYGEWWGNGIQRKYKMPHKVFSLFNTNRWKPENGDMPSCVSVVPVLYEGDWSVTAIDYAMEGLEQYGSMAARLQGVDFMDPEGIIVWHHASRSYFKVLLKNDDKAKGEL